MDRHQDLSGGAKEQPNRRWLIAKPDQRRKVLEVGRLREMGVLETKFELVLGSSKEAADASECPAGYLRAPRTVHHAHASAQAQALERPVVEAEAKHESRPAAL